MVRLFLKIILLYIVLFLFSFSLTSKAQVDFTTDKAAFNTTWPGLTCQDFSAVIIAAFAFKECPSPLNSLSDNTCFAPGDIDLGIEFTESSAPTANGFFLAELECLVLIQSI